MNAIERTTKIESPRPQWIVRPARHVIWQIGKALQDIWRRRPIRPLALVGNGGDARPTVALHADGDTITDRPAATEQVVKSPFAGIDDNGSCRARAWIVHLLGRNTLINYAEGSLERPYLARFASMPRLLRSCSWGATRRTIRSTGTKQ